MKRVWQYLDGAVIGVQIGIVEVGPIPLPYSLKVTVNQPAKYVVAFMLISLNAAFAMDGLGL
jgi:hypothetical protein